MVSVVLGCIYPNGVYCIFLLHRGEEFIKILTFDLANII